MIEMLVLVNSLTLGLNGQFLGQGKRPTCRFQKPKYFCLSVVLTTWDFSRQENLFKSRKMINIYYFDLHHEALNTEETNGETEQSYSQSSKTETWKLALSSACLKLSVQAVHHYCTPGFHSLYITFIYEAGTSPCIPCFDLLLRVF